MLGYFIRRFLLMLLTLLGMSVLVFILLRLMPGNVADILFDASGYADPAERAKIEAELGLDLPPLQQYFAWIGGLLQGDLGYSYVSERRAAEEILPRIPVTAQLAAWALFFSVALGVPLGVISAVRQNTAIDYALRLFSLSGLSVPSFWLALLIMMGFVHWFGFIPIYNAAPATRGEALLMFALPAAAVGFRSSALIMRLTRSSMLEVLRQDYIRTARAKGAADGAVHYRHALRNALLPVVTVIGIEAAFLIGGLIITETVFNIPGIARFLVEAIIWRDYPIVQNLVMFIALVVVLVNFTVDMLYAALDPRIKFAE
jgi:peptide/nickel transport system permease protein